MMPGDSVVAIGERLMSSYSEITKELAEHKGEEVTFWYYRKGSLDSTVVEVDNNGKVGVYLADPLKVYNSIHHEYNFFEAIPVGISYGWNQLVTYARSLKILFTPDGYKGLGGFGTLGGLFPETWEWYSFWNITAFLAVILAFMNVIPIPGLDGGHILFTLWEIVTRRKPSEKFLEVAQTIGMALLLGLLILANGNDILKLFK
jgi:regulator of sigma E protease